MKKTIIAILTLAIVILGLWSIGTKETDGEAPIVVESITEVATSTEPTISHRQKVWIYALEWCESRGVQTAINAEDLDGTPSYYSYQFKPGTFRGYGEQYGVIEKGLSDQEIMELIKDWELQRRIVERMVLDEEVVWETQFPWCVKKLGRPPRD